MAPGTSQTKHERKGPGVSSSSPAADCKFRAEFLPLLFAAGRPACALEWSLLVVLMIVLRSLYACLLQL